MALNLPTFYKRTGSAIVFGIIMLAGLLWSDYAFAVLIAAIQVLCLRDYFRLVRKIEPNAHWPKWLPMTIQAVGLLLLVFTAVCNFYIGHLGIRVTNFLMIGIMPAIVMIIVLMAALDKRTGWLAAMQAIAGLFYIVLPALMLLFMRTVSPVIPVALILMIWTNDTMAYLVGSFIGKTPFSPISPKKTWEGTAGGAILTIVAAAIWGHYAHQFHMADWMALAFCAAVAGTLGDLLESKLKRMADVKDSGTLMPGHGGALDRFDSLLVATPFAFCYVYFFVYGLSY